MKRNLKKLLLPTLLAGAMTAGGALNARADALAVSYLGVSGFTFYSNTSTLAAFNANAFSTLSAQDQLTNTSNLNGSNGPLGSINVIQPPFVASVDASASCIGANCGAIGQNNFTKWTAPPSSTFSYADSLLTGIPISLANNGATSGANAQAIAVTSLLGTAFGGATAEMDLTTSLTFTLATTVLPGTAGLGFSADQYLLPWTSAGSLSPTQAHTSTTWTIELLSNLSSTPIFEWDPTGTATGLTNITDPCNLNRTPAVGANQPGSATTCSGSFLATISAGLPSIDSSGAPITYTLSLVHKASSTANSVPEPSTVALFGVGLLGLWFSRGSRRRRTS